MARQLAGLGGSGRARVFHLSWWSDRLMAQSMADPAFRAHLFRFVDAFPALGDDADVDRHLRAEFAGTPLPQWFAGGLGLSSHLPGGRHLPAAVARRTVTRMAHQFILGTDAEEVSRAVGALWAGGTAATVDLLGEHTHSDGEADAYAARLLGLVEALAAAATGWDAQPRLEADDLGPVPRASVSVKVSALAPAFAPLTAEESLAGAAERLLPVLRRAAELGVSVCFDVERYDTKALTHRLFRQLLDRSELAGLHAGIVVQAYRRDAAEDLAELAEWATGRAVPPIVRLVKGAYWDTETVQAAAMGWAPPVFTDKGQTDANFERLAATLHEHHGVLRAAFASHNLRSLAAAVVDGRHRGVGEDGFEVQLLHGMAEPVHQAVRDMGLRLRVYAPMGELVPGMAYLVRRLLENTSNESFVRHHFAEGDDLSALLQPPDVDELPGPQPLTRRSATDQRRPGPYRPEPPAEWRRRPVLASFAAAVEAEFRRPSRFVPAVIGGEPVRTGRTLLSVDPAAPGQVVAEVAACTADDARAAVEAACRAAPRWVATPFGDRAAVLLRTAAALRDRRQELAALVVREVGKGWADADADVCEAIDACEYYARQALRMAGGAEVQSPPGEHNRLRYVGRGVAAVVPPWNFPLAIPTALTAAALVTGNAVVLKPAEQAPACAAALVAAFGEAGLPADVLSFVPGTGEEAGAALVAHPAVDVVAFTGSRAVGLGIIAAAARAQPGRRSIARVVAELGGKNAVIVDGDADLDEVVPAVLASAFGYAGQKCSAASRLIVVGSRHDAVVERVAAAARALTVAPPRRPGSQVGPVIDAEAYERLLGALARAGDCGRVVLSRTDVPAEGWFVGPAVVADVDPGSWLATEELFGPVLATFAVPDVDAAVELANRVDEALTAGVFSRNPDTVARVVDGVRAGAVYVNRAITGAVVGRQPFGGRGLSGVGSPAGGPDYLLQFCDCQVVSENTVRQGFADPVPLGLGPSGDGNEVAGAGGGATANGTGTAGRGTGTAGKGTGTAGRGTGTAANGTGATGAGAAGNGAAGNGSGTGDGTGAADGAGPAVPGRRPGRIGHRRAPWHRGAA